MNRTALVTALLLATTSAYALDARINTGLQIAGMTAEGDANASVDLKAQKEAAAAAKASGNAAISDAKAQAEAKMGAAQASVAGFKQSAEMKIGAKDRIALAKHYASGKAANKLMGKMFGSTDASAPEAGYESKLVLGAKLDAGLAKSAVNVDASSVAKPRALS